MNGKVQGFPTAVPIAEDKMLARIIQAQTPPKIKCKPTNGVNEIAAPQANPPARV